MSIPSFLPSLTLLAAALLPAPVVATITTQAEYHLGEAGSLSSSLPQDSSGQNRHFTSASAGAAAVVREAGQWAPGSSASLALPAAAHSSWDASAAFASLPTDNFAFGLFVRANSMLSADVLSLGTQDGALKLSLGDQGWAGSAHNTAWIGPQEGVVHSFAPGHWVHLALIRREGSTRFYLNGEAQGSPWSGTPVNGTARLGSNPASDTYFDGEIDEARVVSFTAEESVDDILAALWDAADLPEPLPQESLREQTLATVPGTSYVATLEVQSASSDPDFGPLSLQIEGASQTIHSLSSPSASVSEAIPFRIAFTADAAQTTLRLNRPTGLATAAPIISTLEAHPSILATPSDTPSPGQQEQIERRYGLFLHYGMNTFHNEDWTDGSKPASSYQPTAIDVDQWVRTAREAGMQHIILIVKHHDGFCLWDSPWTDYDVASSPNDTDIVQLAAAACKRYGVQLGIYYSLWDRHEPSYANPAAYKQYLLRQLTEIMSNYGPICELWLDGAWDRPREFWPSVEIYDLVKSLQPQCQISTNWTIGLPDNPDAAGLGPQEQEAGYPIRYFPADFRTADPKLPAFPDPKLFSHMDSNYYLPLESTITLSAQNQWFYHTDDNENKPIDTLLQFYYQATAQDNVLIFNAPPNRDGVLRQLDIDTLHALRSRLGLHPGLALPSNRSRGASGTSNSIWEDNEATYGAARALDQNPNSRWAAAAAATPAQPVSIEIDFGEARSFDRVLLDEYEEDGSGRIQAFALDVWDGSSWQQIHQGSSAGRYSLHEFAPQRSSRLRLRITETSGPPSLWQLQAQQSHHGFVSWRQLHFGSQQDEPQADWNADPDGDRLPNRIEFLRGTDPLHADPVLAPQRQGQHMELDLSWRAEASTELGSMLYSLDLQHWHDAFQPIHPGIQLSHTGNSWHWKIDTNKQARWFYRFK